MKAQNLNLRKSRRTAAVIMILLAVSAITFGQSVNHKNGLVITVKERIFGKAENESIFRTVSYHESAEMVYSPAISRTIHTTSLDVIYEDCMPVESWMIAP